MQVKTYRGSDTQAALARVKAELGDDAIILNTKTVRTGGGKSCEITAAIDPRAQSGNGGHDKSARDPGGFMPQPEGNPAD